MPSHNASIRFIISGFDKTERPIAVGVTILITYVVCIAANIANIFFIVFDKRLHKPMYILICNLAVVDIVYTSSSGPTMVGVLLSGIKTVSFIPCICQMFIFHVGGVMEMFGLAVMSFDRLIAISCPFQYHRYLTNARTLMLTYALWLSACAFVSVMPATVLPLSHCHFKLKYTFCDYAGIVRTTCSDHNYYFNLVTIVSFFILFFSFGMICLSYFSMICFVKLSTTDEKRKIGGTCLTHLIVVICYFFPQFILIVLTRMGLVLTLEARHGLTIGATLGPSLVNPFVYCLRTNEIRFRIFKVFGKRKTSQ